MKIHTHAFRAMGGPCEIQLGSADADLVTAAHAAAELEVRRIEAKYSRYRADSLLSQINAQAGADWVTCDEETLRLLDVADTLHRQTEGLFDATSGVLRRAWRFDGTTRPPQDADLAPLLALVGWAGVQRQGTQVRLQMSGMELDFGGFGKEYAVDRVAALCRQRGVEHGLVNLAGDIRVWGGRPDGTPWQLGIQHPRQPSTLLGHLPLVEGALTTSGDYERFILDETGRRHCHILHPATGQSACHWQGVSVIAPLALMAGGISTAAMLMGDKALPWLRAQPVDFLAVDAHGTIFTSNTAGDS